MQTRGHHRSDFRTGPWANFARRKAELLQRLIGPTRVLDRIVRDIRPAGRPDTYYIPGGAALLLKARMVLEEALPLANDTEGEIFQ